MKRNAVQPFSRAKAMHSSSAGILLAFAAAAVASAAFATPAAAVLPSPSPPGLPVPFTSFVLKSPFDVALAVSLAVLPLLLVIWLFVFGRTWAEARRERDADIRLALAADLGLSPRELGSLTTEGLFKLREQAAFDDLTGVLRRAAGIAALEREI